MKVKSKDIAKKLGLSPATVSLVLNNKPGISPETRDRVFSLLQEYGYEQPKAPQLTPASNKTLQFVIYQKHGLVVSDTPFFSTLTEAINREARASGYSLTITYINEQKDDIEAILSDMVQNSPSGLLILATEMFAEDIGPFQRLGIPLLLLDSQFDHVDIDTVCINNADGVYKAMDYFYHLGYSNIGYLRSSIRIYNFDQRFTRFRAYAADRKVRIEESNIFPLESTTEGAYQDMKRLLKERRDTPDALFADNDIIASGAIRALKEFGLSIPEDVSIIGFDDMPFCEMLEPSLTTIRVFKQEMGTTAVRRLIDVIENPQSKPQKIYISTELVPRRSTREYA